MAISMSLELSTHTTRIRFQALFLGTMNTRFPDYLRERDEVLDNVSGVVAKQYRCIKYHSRGCSGKTDFPEKDVDGKALLDSDPNLAMSIHNIIVSVKGDDNAHKVAEVATGEDTCTPEYALAYFVG